MRGDSLRDLYAKTLALLGLAVLAGVGALVDYWPVGLTFPAAQSPVHLPAPVDRTLFAHEPIDVVPVIASARTRSRQRGVVSNDTSRQVLAEPPAFQHAETALTSRELVPEPVLFVADNGLTSASSPARIPMALPDRVVTVDEAFTDQAPMPLRASMAAASGGEDGDGLITGAFKKTGSSIIKTGARTGTSIVDAMRVVSSVVRRALPTD